MTGPKRSSIVHDLQCEILRLEGFKASRCTSFDAGLGSMANAFPNRTFPLGAVHEFLSSSAEDNSATIGFITGLLSSIMGISGTAMWISTNRRLFPPSLKNFSVQPDRIIFVDLQNEKDLLRAMEEALKCGALTAVIGEMEDISFTASRRLQLAVEESQVTGFIVRPNYKKVNTTACVSRWRITPLPSGSIEDLPGVGYPQWKIELLRIRNGRPGVWNFRWQNGRFVDVMINDGINKNLTELSPQQAFIAKKKVG